MDIIATERCGKKLCLDGFMYTVKYENKSKTETTWRCVRRVADYCHAILKTANDEVSTLAKPHNHPSDKTAVEIEKCRQIMKQQANTTNDIPNQVLTFSTATTQYEVKTRLPKPDTFKRGLRRARAQHRPTDLSSLQELSISNHWSQTVGPNTTQFLYYDNICVQIKFNIKCYNLIIFND